MPKLTTDEIVIDAWNCLHNPTKEESEKFLEILEKLLTNNK